MKSHERTFEQVITHPLTYGFPEKQFFFFFNLLNKFGSCFDRVGRKSETNNIFLGLNGGHFALFFGVYKQNPAPRLETKCVTGAPSRQGSKLAPSNHPRRPTTWEGRVQFQ